MAEPRFSVLGRTQIGSILDQNTYDPTDKAGLLPIEMRFLPFNETGEAGNYNMLNAAETKARLQQWCRDAFVFLDPEYEDLDSHVERLDELLSPLMMCSFQVHKKQLTRDDIIDRACALLARLPCQPPELPFDHERKPGGDGPWPAQYFSSTSTPEVPGNGYEWARLRVFSRPSTNVVRIALLLVMESSVPIGFTSAYSDTIALLLDTATELHLHSTKSETDSQAHFVLQAFLWATWQQTVLMQLWYDARKQMALGYVFERHNYLVSKAAPVVRPTRQMVEKFRPNYMCKWAFELLRSDLSSVTQDFRRLFQVYNAHFGNRAPRCNLTASEGSLRICDGKAPGNCQRFESGAVEDQSAHDFDCPGSACICLTWDEQSYMNLKGARAISLEGTDEKHLRYCSVSGETMAVSHVWSHGQGGRPEPGFNICLHRRYTKLARALGCTSYWMDSPCIPTDHDLRAEAIGQINENFGNSKVTLLVDRDIMDIDINPLILEAKEAILAALVVCDWNVRAWTLLEGMRGRLKLHILCKDNQIISLVDVLNDILAHSSLTLVSPCLAVHHYIPTDHHAIDTPPVTIEQATCLLNHRHATKDRDVPMIWSLVCGTTVIKVSADFWKSKVGEPLATGFLLSSAPRLDSRGFSWAPSRPNLLPPTAAAPSAKQYPAFDGQDSLAGYIRAEGFRAEWLACPIRRSRALPTWISLHSFAQGDSQFEKYYKIYNGGANSDVDVKGLLNLRSILAPVLKRYRWAVLLLPALRDRGTSGATAPPRPFPYQGQAKGPLMVVAASNDQAEWEWQFVYEWDPNFQLPEFTLVELLLV
ncbi:hypothetical protein BJX76DRAFT_367005 [Aspergillus varians]